MPKNTASSRPMPGRGAVSIPVPSDNGLIDAQLFAQWVVVDAGGQLLGLGALSNGLRIQLGN